MKVHKILLATAAASSLWGSVRAMDAEARQNQLASRRQIIAGAGISIVSCVAALMVNNNDESCKVPAASLGMATGCSLMAYGVAGLERISVARRERWVAALGCLTGLSIAHTIICSFPHEFN